MKGGKVGAFGGAGVGKTVIIMELIQNIAMKLSLSVITPNGVDFEGEVDSVVIPTDIGEIEVLPGHRPIVTILAPGKLVLKNGGSGDADAVDQEKPRRQLQAG